MKVGTETIMIYEILSVIDSELLDVLDLVYSFRV